MKKTIQFAILLLFTSLLSACSFWNHTPADPNQPYKGFTQDQLFNVAEHRLAKGNYTGAVKYFEALDTLYPFGIHSQQAQLDIIAAYYKSEDFVSAEAAADRYIHLYPREANVDYAYYMKGMSQINENRTFLERILPVDMSSRDLANAQSAFFTFRDLIQMFPNSQYVPAAHQQMIYLRDLFAKHELDVGDYYFKRKAYVAASNRATYVIAHYQGTPQVFYALVMLVQSDRALGLTQSANDALRVLQTNYPDSPIVKKLSGVSPTT